LQVHASLKDIKDKDATALHDMILNDPVAASKCFHKTVQMTFEFLLNSTLPSVRGFSAQLLPLDGFACQLNPGMIGYLTWFMGVCEPQMRKALICTH